MRRSVFLTIAGIMAFGLLAGAHAQVEFGTPTAEPAGNRTGRIIVHEGGVFWLRKAKDPSAFWLRSLIQVNGDLPTSVDAVEISDFSSNWATVGSAGALVISKLDASQHSLTTGEKFGLRMRDQQNVALIPAPYEKQAPMRFEELSGNDDIYVGVSLIADKTGGEPNNVIYVGDGFTLRLGWGDNLWITSFCPSAALNRRSLCLTDNKALADIWTFSDTALKPQVIPGTGAPPPTQPSPPPKVAAPPGATPKPGGSSQPQGGPYICYGSQELNFAGCKGSMVYACNSGSSARTVRVSYYDADGPSTRTLETTITVPGNAGIGTGAMELPGGSMFGPDTFGGGVCRSRSHAIVSVN